MTITRATAGASPILSLNTLTPSRELSETEQLAPKDLLPRLTPRIEPDSPPPALLKADSSTPPKKKFAETESQITTDKDRPAIPCGGHHIIKHIAELADIDARKNMKIASRAFRCAAEKATHNLKIIGSKGLDKLLKPRNESGAHYYSPYKLELSGDFTSADLERLPDYVTHLIFPACSIDGQRVLSSSNLESLRKLPNLTSLSIEFMNIGDKEAEVLGTLENLTELYLPLNNITAIGATSLAQLKKLKILDLAQNQISNEGAAEIGTMTNLTVLGLESCGLTGAALPALANLKKLSALSLAFNEIGYQNLISLEPLTEIQHLNMETTHLGDRGLSMISKMFPRMIELNASGNSITNDGLKDLSARAALLALFLDENNIDSDGLANLQNMTSLSILTISHNNLRGELSSLVNLKQLRHLDARFSGITSSAATDFELARPPIETFYWS